MSISEHVANHVACGMGGGRAWEARSYGVDIWYALVKCVTVQYSLVQSLRQDPGGPGLVLETPCSPLG